MIKKAQMPFILRVFNSTRNSEIPLVVFVFLLYIRRPYNRAKLNELTFQSMNGMQCNALVFAQNLLFYTYGRQSDKRKGNDGNRSNKCIYGIE